MLILTFNSLTGCDQARKYVDQSKPRKKFAFNNCKSKKNEALGNIDIGDWSKMILNIMKTKETYNKILYNIQITASIFPSIL